MEIDKYSYISGAPLIQYTSSGAKFKVGKFCSLGDHLTVWLGGNHNTNWVSTYPFGHLYTDVFNTFDGHGCPSTKGDVVVGNDVWMGSNVTIMSGVTIGDGAVIANNSHVVKNVKPYTIVGGNPAQFIKNRFSEEQINKLLNIKWWDWDDEKINKYAPLLSSDNIDEFISQAQSL